MAYEGIGDLAAAAAEFLGVIDDAGAEPFGYEGLARVLFAQGKSEQARWRIDAAIARGGSPDAALLLGDILLAQQRYAEARSTFGHLTRSAPTYAAGYDGLARALIELDGWEDALLQAAKATALAPDFATGQATLGRILVRLDRAAEALQPLSRVIELQPDGVSDSEVTLDARLDLSRAYFDLHHFRDSEANASFVIVALETVGTLTSTPSEEPPIAARAYLWRAYLLRALARSARRQYKSANSDVRLASRLVPESRHFCTALQGFWSFEEGDYRLAWQTLGQVAETWDARPQSMTLLELSVYPAVLRALGRYEDARVQFDRLIQHDANHSQAWLSLASLFLEREEYTDLSPGEGGRISADTVAELSSRELSYEAGWRAMSILKSRPLTPAVTLALGHICLVLDQTDDAASYLAQAVALAPASALAHANCGLLFSGRRQYRRAAESFEKAVRCDPGDISIRCKLAELNVRLGNLDPAESDYRRIVEDASGTVEAQIGLGEVLTRVADNDDEPELYAEAVEHFSEAVKLSRTMNGLSSGWEGSARLNDSQAASVLYARGYARAKLYEVRDGLLSRSSRGLLMRATEDFKEATKLDPRNHKAARAYAKVVNAKGIGRRGTWLDDVAPPAVAGFSLLALVAAQIAFFSQWPVKTGAAEWLAATLSLLLFVLAAASFPQLLKLKVGGVELERGAADVSVSTSVGLTYQPAILPSVAFVPPHPDLGAPRGSWQGTDDAAQGSAAAGDPDARHGEGQQGTYDAAKGSTAAGDPGSEDVEATKTLRAPQLEPAGGVGESKEKVE